MSEPLTTIVGRFAAAADGDPAAAVAAVVELVAEARGVDVGLRVDGRRVRPDPRVVDVGMDLMIAAEHGPVLPGLLREALVGVSNRRGRGVHHTPMDIAGVVVEMAFGVLNERVVAAAGDGVASGAGRGDRADSAVRWGDPGGVVADPSVGGGIFLLAAAQRMSGASTEIVDRLVGCDVDPLAVAATEAALALWSGGHRPSPGAIRVGDFLGDRPFGEVRPRVVVGNPPFLGQLKATTGRDGEGREELRARWPDVGGYIDDAGAFLLRATEVVEPGGVVALLQPSSFLAARDATPVRSRLNRSAPPAALWTVGERIFDASVDVCAVACIAAASAEIPRPTAPGGVADRVRLFHGVPPADRGRAPVPDGDSWAALVAAASGVPGVALGGRAEQSETVIGDLATVSAGFRDHFYGLRDAVVEDADGDHPLITSGLIDPLRCHWGHRRCRFDRRQWAAPSVVIERIDPVVRPWFEDRLRPKLLVASQTKVIEAIVDPGGVMVPCTPVIVVVPHDPADLWRLAAVLTSPVATVEMAAAMSGSALSPDALRITAAHVRGLVVPAPGPALDRASHLARSSRKPLDTAEGRGAGLAEIGRCMISAHGSEVSADPETLLDWWRARLP